MFSRDKALHPTENVPSDMTPLIRASFAKFLDCHELCGGFFCIWNDQWEDTEMILAEGIPEAPFMGSRHESLVTLLKDCLQRYPAPHVHSFGNTSLWNDMVSIGDLSNWQRRVLFIPAYVFETKFIFLCFADNNMKLDLTPEIENGAIGFVTAVEQLRASSFLRHRLHVMELYVREIGHDIASSVQAIVAKLRNVSSGRLEGEAAIARVRQAEEEIMSVYRSADTLGITVDPDYNLGSGDDFDVRASIEETLIYCQSEAEERHIDLRIDLPNNPVMLWGDEKGIQSALIQLLMNAIKYAKGSSYVMVRVVEKNSLIEFTVTDRGKTLEEAEVAHMWEFGWRGEKAKELHVNGSGIGLYTVKKIVQAHGGTVHAWTAFRSSDIVTFAFRIPRRDILKKNMLL